tara:strand:- start:332 stop:535 length:204 start_codon:yes stop_codon:yes gene_type:complete
VERRDKNRARKTEAREKNDGASGWSVADGSRADFFDRLLRVAAKLRESLDGPGSHRRALSSTAKIQR